MPRISERQQLLNSIEQLIMLKAITKAEPSESMKLIALFNLVNEQRYLDIDRTPIPKQVGMRCIIFQLPEQEFKQVCRMYPVCFDHLLAQIMDDDVFTNYSRNKQTNVEYQLVVALETLGCYGNGASVGRFARSNGIGNGTVVLMCQRVFTAIENNIQSIKWPNAQTRKRISAYFHSNYGLPNVVGVVDGTHIHFEQKPAKDGEVYWTRKHRYSLNAQLVCDEKKRIIYYQVGWPGSVFDNTCFKETELCLNPDRFFNRREYLLGDSAYQRSVRMLTPFVNPEAQIPLNTRFNVLFSSARVIIEHVMGLLNARWGCLKGLRTQLKKDSFESDMERALKQIKVCFLLHNFTLDRNDRWEEDYDIEAVNQQHPYLQAQDDLSLRNVVKQYLVETGRI